MYKWQLDDLYVGYESEEFKSDWAKLKQYKEDFKQLTLEDNLEDIKAAVKFKEELLITARRIGSFISLTLSTNTTDETSTNYRGKFSKVMSELTKNQIILDRFLEVLLPILLKIVSYRIIHLPLMN